MAAAWDGVFNNVLLYDLLADTWTKLDAPPSLRAITTITPYHGGFVYASEGGEIVQYSKIEGFCGPHQFGRVARHLIAAVGRDLVIASSIAGGVGAFESDVAVISRPN